MKRGIRVVVNILLALGLLVYGFASKVTLAEAPKKTLKIGNLSPMSGAAAGWGILAERGMRTAAEDINAKGGVEIGGERYAFKIVTYDHKYAMADAVSAVNKAVLGDKIRYVQFLGGGVMGAVLPTFRANKTIVVGEMGLGKELTNDQNPTVFRIMPSQEQTMAYIGPAYVQKLGIKRLAILAPDDEMHHGMAKIFDAALKRWKIPAQIVSMDFYERETIDFVPFLTRILLKKPEMIEVLGSPSGSTSLIVKQVHQLAPDVIVAAASGSIDYVSLVEVAGKDAAEGVIAARTWPPDSPPTKRFVDWRQRYLDRYKEEPQAVAYEVYAVLEYLADSLHRAGTTDTEKVAKVMWGNKVETILGSLRCIGPELGYTTEPIRTQFAVPLPIVQMQKGKVRLLTESLKEPKK